MYAFPDVSTDPIDRPLPDCVTLADDPALQAELIAAAYATGRPERIDHVLNSVADVRRMQVTGILEWFRDADDDPADGTTPP